MKYLLLGVMLSCLLVPGAFADHHENADAEAMAAAQEAWMKAMTPGPQHGEMAKMVGEFKMTTQMWMSPTGEPMVSEGTATRTLALGGRVLEEVVNSSVMGMPFKGVGRTGYDNATGKWWSTWTDNMSTGVIMTHGDHDAESGTMTFTGMWPDPQNPANKVPMTMESKVDDKGREVATFHLGEGDAKYRSMVITYERK